MRYTKWLGTLCAIGLLCLHLQTGLAQAAPENGAWWNPNQMGSGFGIEIQGNTLLMAGFLYENDGRATWHVSVGPMQNATTYQGRLLAFSNGQTLTGAYQAPAAPTDAGAVTLQFTDDSHGTLTWPGGTIPIDRARYGSGTASFQPKTGVWGNTAEFGRGFFIEVQGDQMLVAGAMYDANGKPVWYVSVGAMASPTTYQGAWSQYANGQTLTGPYQPPSAPTHVGTFSLEFSARTQATLTLFAGGATASRVADLGSPTVIILEPLLPYISDLFPPPDEWRGMVKFTRHTVYEGLDDTLSFEGPVWWIREPPDPTKIPRYIILAGEIIVAHKAVLGGAFGITCTLRGETQLTLKSNDGFLFQDHLSGRYAGQISAVAKFSSTVTCPGFSQQEVEDEGSIDLEIEGTLDEGYNARMKGEMKPITAFGSKFTGSWDFVPIRSL